MTHQNLENHRKFDPLFFIGIALTSLFTLVLSIIFLIRNTDNLLLGIIILLISIIIIFITARLRGYALTLQDRIIRSEENFGTTD